MKKVTILSFAIVTVAIAAIWVFNSCGKQEISDQVLTHDQEKILQMDDDAILNKIFNFKEKMSFIKSNPNYKSSEVTTIDSAIWYMDATLNLSHAFISWTTMNNFHFDSVFISINNDEGKINYSDMAIVYFDLKQMIAEVCMITPGNDKELYITTLSKNTVNDESIIIKADVTIGSRTVTPDYHPFEKGWKYGDVLGDCYDSLQYSGFKDACTELRDKTNEFRYLYVNDEQMLYIGMPNEEPYEILHSEDLVFVNENDPNPGDNYYEHLLIYQTQLAGYHDCIDETEMNWYYHKLNDVIYNIVPNNQEYWPNAFVKTFIEINADPDPLTGTFGTKRTNSSPFIIRHQYKVEYRYAIYVGGRSEPTSINEN